MGLVSFAKKIVMKIGGSGTKGSLFATRVKYFTAHFMKAVKGEEGYAKWFFKLYTHKDMNLENPQTTADKFWWFKLNHRDPLMTITSDKVAARQYVADCGFEDILIPQYEVLDKVRELELSKYNEEVIVKCSHNSGGHLFYNPQNPPSKKQLKDAKKRFAFLLKQDASALSLEWNYKDIPHKLIVEKLLRSKDGKIPYDYKFWCMDGVPHFMVHIGERFKENGLHNDEIKETPYDMDFNVMDFDEVGLPYSHEQEEKPENWDYMVEIAKKLSAPFPFCRVDLYNVDGKVYFGEMTYFDEGGCIQFEPEEWDKQVASWMDINSKSVKLREKNGKR